MLRSAEWWFLTDVSGQPIILIFTGQTVKSLTAWTFKMGPIDCRETPVRIYHSALRNMPEERRSHSHHVGNLQPHELYL